MQRLDIYKHMKAMMNACVCVFLFLYLSLLYNVWVGEMFSRKIQLFKSNRLLVTSTANRPRINTETRNYSAPEFPPWFSFST